MGDGVPTIHIRHFETCAIIDAQEMMGIIHDRQSLSLPKNRLLASLSEPDYEQLQADLEPSCTIDRCFIKPISRFRSSIFSKPALPRSCTQCGTASLRRSERSVTNGFVEVPVLLGDKQAPNSIYMQVPGFGLRVKSGVLSCAIEKSPMTFARFTARQPARRPRYRSKCSLTNTTPSTTRRSPV